MTTTGSTVTIPTTVVVRGILLNDKGEHVVEGRNREPVERDFEIVIPPPSDKVAPYYQPVTEVDVVREETKPPFRGLRHYLTFRTTDGHRCHVSMSDLPATLRAYCDRLGEAQQAERVEKRVEEDYCTWAEHRTCRSCGELDYNATSDEHRLITTGEQVPLCPPCARIITRLRDEAGRLEQCRKYLRLPTTTEPKRRR